MQQNTRVNSNFSFSSVACDAFCTSLYGSSALCSSRRRPQENISKEFLSFLNGPRSVPVPRPQHRWPRLMAAYRSVEHRQCPLRSCRSSGRPSEPSSSTRLRCGVRSTTECQLVAVRPGLSRVSQCFGGLGGSSWTSATVLKRFVRARHNDTSSVRSVSSSGRRGQLQVRLSSTGFWVLSVRRLDFPLSLRILRFAHCYG